MPRTLREIVSDPCASFWLRNAASALLDRDPVDAANDAEALATAANAWLDECQRTNPE